MTRKLESLRVHLDHLIPRQSVRYIYLPHNASNNPLETAPGGQEDRNLRYEDIKRQDGWFKQIRKPDFQRETNAWTPTDCIDFLDSVVNGRIIPSIILWNSPENSFTYVLDGAHRLSVLRAWMSDDWGDKAGDYYARRNDTEIKKVAQITRELVQKQIGLFIDFQTAHIEYTELGDQGKIQKKEMGQKRFSQASFYQRVMGGLNTLAVQWEKGNYESAEQSFLRINRKGQALDPWEATLIEHRRGSYARSIMCIANGGEPGHYWPTPTEEDEEANQKSVKKKIDSFSDKAKNIYKKLFVPPYELPIISLTVPLMVAPEYFQKHKYLLEIIPLLVDREVVSNDKQVIDRLKVDDTAPPQLIIDNADKTLTKLDKGLEHLITFSNNSTSLSIVPLFYWYNHKGQFARGLLYGFLYWLLAGTKEEIVDRKLIFSGNRERFEDILFYLKPDISTIQARGGAGLKATRRAAEFYQATLKLLHENPQLQPGSEDLYSRVLDELADYASIPKRKTNPKRSRAFSSSDKSQINIRELFESGSIRCHICGGVVNLLQPRGIQYDHKIDYEISKITDPETGKPTHPFCNRYKKDIQNYKQDRGDFHIPLLTKSAKKAQKIVGQMDIFTFMEKKLSD